MNKIDTDIQGASKDQFFKQIGELADAMIEAHGKDFAMGVLILAARFIAGGQEAKFTSQNANKVLTTSTM
jgi:hypothetical protein